MAATGLLGFNPYNTKGLALDISSKPVNLAIQLQQKEAAKREALDKYFMDYEKSLNPAGMRGIDQDAFLGKLGEAKQYYLQNRDKILNPAKYGAESQSTYNSYLKEAQSLIGQSKAQAAEDKVVAEHIYQATQQGKTIHDGIIPMIDASHLSIKDPRFKRVDPYALQFDKPHDEAIFNKNVWGNITLPTQEIENKLPNGKVSYTKESYLTKPIINTAVTNALNEYTSNPGTTKHLNDLSKNPAIFNSANDIFGETFKYTDPKTNKEVKPKIENIEQFVAGYALLKKPTGEMSTSKADYSWLTKFNKQEYGRNQRAQFAAANTAGGSIDTYIDDSDTKTPIPEKTDLTKLTFGPKVADEYIKEVIVPKDAVEYDIMATDPNLPYQTKKVSLTPAFGRKGNDVFVAYSTLDKNGKQTGKYDWANATKLTGDVRSTILNKVSGSKFKVAGLGTTNKKKTGASNLN
jgi:hypothetical protein